MNECAYCGEQIATLPSEMCGPDENDEECPCCGLTYKQEIMIDEITTG